MKNKNRREIIILGSSHLAVQSGFALLKKKYIIKNIGTERFAAETKKINGFSALARYKEILKEAGIGSASVICIIDDDDRRNIELALAASAVNKTIPILVSVFNKDLSPHFQSIHKRLRVISPAEISASRFAEALRSSKHFSGSNSDNSSLKKYRQPKKTDYILFGLVLSYIVFLALSVSFFHWANGLSWINAAYFVVATITTVGYGDINLLGVAGAIKIYGIILMLVSLVSVWMIFSLIIDRLLRHRSEAALGRKHYKMKNHIIVCGLGRVGYRVVENLLNKGKDVLVIEISAENKFLELVKGRGAKVFIGDASIPQVLIDAGIQKAAGIVSVINDDIKNLEIGLNARLLRSNLTVVLRIFDNELSREIEKKLKVNCALSTSEIAAAHVVTLVDNIIYSGEKRK